MIEFVNPQEYSGTVNILLYGPPKTGKSSAAASAPGPILYLNEESPSALRFARRVNSGKDIREFKVTGGSDLDSAYLYLRDSDCATVVVDSIGELYNYLLDEASKGGRPTLPQRGDVNTKIYRFIKTLCDMPINVVVVCHEQTVEDGDESKTMPLTGGRALPQQLCALVDVIGYTRVGKTADGEPRYYAQLVSANGRYAGARDGVLGPAEDLNLTNWIERYGNQV